MSITIKIETGGFDVKAKNFENKTIKTIADELNRFGIKAVGQAKRDAPVDEGGILKSIAFEPASPTKLSVQVSVSANYAAYIEFGTRKFAAEYVATLPPNWQAYAATFRGKAGGSYQDFIFRLTAWVKRKGIATGDDIDNVAYLIAKKIMREGIRPHPFFVPAIEYNLKILKDRLK